MSALRLLFEAAVALAVSAAASEIEELTDLKGLRENFEYNEFNILSMYTSDEYSKLVDTRIAGARRLMLA